MTRHWQRGPAVAGALSAALALVACSSGGSTTTTPEASVNCAPFAEYGSFQGKTVNIFSSIRDIEAKRFEDSFKAFEKCTGITIKWEGSGDFETQLQVRVKGNNAPDLATIPQPGLLATLVTAGAVKKPSAKVAAAAVADYSKDWLGYATVNGTMYAPPLGANVKSFVWYSPKDFKDKGYAVPQTWDELMALTAKIAATGAKPWCAGIESGVATGWAATDWIEDVLLRTQGPDVYDQWVTHKIPFNDPRVIDAIDKVGAILKNPKYVNGGFGDVKSIATTSFQEAGTPITTGDCWMHRQASFYANQWPKGTKVGDGTTPGKEGDVSAFYLPPVNPATKPVLGAGEFNAAFNEKPETQAVQLYMMSSEWVNKKAKIGDWITANKNMKIENVLSAGTSDPNPINVLSAQLLQDSKSVFRFDGSDQMPSAVGAGSFWKGMVAWITGKSTKEVADAIEASWPAH